jgi:tRNA pseudouridine55 synthase
MILPVYKPLGASTHLLAKKAGDIYQTKATHTGTLDPMANGVVIVLTNQDRFDKEKLSSWQKQYQFEILWGIETDSHDLLGLTTAIDQNKYDQDKINTQIKLAIPQFTGVIQQQLPKFSAKRISGESYFDKAKREESFTPRSEEVQIHDLELKRAYLISRSQLQQQLKNKIKLVTGDFRQEQILNNWQQVIPQLPDKLVVTRLLTTTSKRTYIRALVRDIAQQLQLPATTFSLTRTQNGEFSIRDCICLI